MTEPPPDVPAWAAPLHGKYVEMLRLRRGDLDGSIADPRAAMAALATGFPGSLREIDMLPLDELARRAEHLGRVVASVEPPAPWAMAMAGYHRHLRGALGVKRWLGRQRTVDAALAARFEREVASLPYGEDLQAWSDSLAAVAAPPTGRLLPLVLARLEADTGLAPDTLRELVLGPRRGKAGR